MRVRPDIGVRRPMAAVRAFGLLASGWPVRRRGRTAAGAEKRIDAVERRFRRERPAAPPARAAGPVKFSLTNLTLCPRLEILWQSHYAAVTEMHTDAPLRGDVPAAMRDRIVRHLAPGLSRSVERTERRWHRLSSLHLSVLERYWSEFCENAASDRPKNASAPVPGHRAIRPLILLERRSRHTTYRHGRFVRSELHYQLERAKRVAETTEARLSRILRTTVMRRVTGSGPAADAAPLPKPVDRRVAGTMLRTARSSAPAPRAVPAPERVFRDEVAVPPAAPAVPARAPQFRQSDEPQLDIAGLDKELWRRFEKRIRIEHERRGRG